MSSANVLHDHGPSAPPESVAEQQYKPLYPLLPNAESFRLGKIGKIEKQISDEAQHYRLVLKKYKKAQKASSYIVAGLGVATTALSSGAVASALTGVGIVVGVPLGIVGGVCGAVSTVLMGVNKNLERRSTSTAGRLSALAAAKHNTIKTFVSKLS